MAKLEFNIPNDKVARIMTALKHLKPVPTNAQGQPVYTDLQWAKKLIKESIIGLVYRAEYSMEQKKINIVKDDDLID